MTQRREKRDGGRAAMLQFFVGAWLGFALGTVAICILAVAPPDYD
jgi:hypothetical protein